MRTFGKAKGGGRRKAQRDDAPLLAVLSTLSADHRAAIVNISRSGARLSGPDLPQLDEQLIFRADTVQAFGRVIWSKESQCGVAFDIPMVPGEVDRLRHHAGMWSFAGSTAEDRAAAEEWQRGNSR